MLLVEPGEQDVFCKLRLNCSVDDVMFALKDDATVQKFAQVAESDAAAENAG
jgi:hypothetical protein